ncbi:MAG: DUF5652 family protein [Candidatus Falkowbacteria bacterium]|nr:DUF5652 family protein [Candidatus Falkowbacteria bacterium]
MPDFIYFATHFSWLLILFILWTAAWKGVALWKAARNNSLAWFIILFVINTAGILEIIYIFAVKAKMSQPINKEAIGSTTPVV